MISLPLSFCCSLRALIRLHVFDAPHQASSGCPRALEMQSVQSAQLWFDIERKFYAVLPAVSALGLIHSLERKVNLRFHLWTCGSTSVCIVANCSCSATQPGCALGFESRVHRACMSCMARFSNRSRAGRLPARHSSSPHPWVTCKCMSGCLIHALQVAVCQYVHRQSARRT